MGNLSLSNSSTQLFIFPRSAVFAGDSFPPRYSAVSGAETSVQTAVWATRTSSAMRSVHIFASSEGCKRFLGSLHASTYWLTSQTRIVLSCSPPARQEPLGENERHVIEVLNP